MAIPNPMPARKTLAAIRYGYGLRPGQAMPEDADGLLAQIAKGAQQKPRFPREGLAGRRETATRILSLRAAEAKAAKEGKPNETIRKQTQQEAQRILRADSMARIVQAAQSPYGFFERLASFWVDHFSTSAIKAFPMRMIVPLYEAEAIRPNLGGTFTGLLKAAILHPAMLIYLDQNDSVAPESEAGRKNGRGLNENLGRELLELHTLGAGSGYSQDDVRAAALVLTGLAVDYKAMQVIFVPRRAQADPVSLLGRSYDDEDMTGQDHVLMLEDLAADPRTAAHISTKLAAHFIADEPPAEVVEAMIGAWAASKGNLTDVYRAMLSHPRAWTDPGEKIKRPFEFVVSGFRALDLPERSFADMLDTVEGAKAGDGSVGEAVGKAVGQAVGKAIDMAGQVTGNGTTKMSGAPAGDVPVEEASEDERKRKAQQADALTLAALKRMGQPVWQPPSPAGFTDRTEAWLTPSQLTERIAWSRLVARTFGQNLEPSQFLQTALADAASPDTATVIAQAPNRLHGLTMVLVSPEFNRR